MTSANMDKLRNGREGHSVASLTGEGGMMSVETFNRHAKAFAIDCPSPLVNNACYSEMFQAVLFYYCKLTLFGQTLEIENTM